MGLIQPHEQGAGAPGRTRACDPQSRKVIGLAWVDVGYVALGLPVAAIQGAVAHTNYTGRWNVVTRRVLLIHRGVGR